MAKIQVYLGLIQAGVITPSSSGRRVNYDTNPAGYSFTVEAILDSDSTIKARRDVTIEVQDAPEENEDGESFSVRFTSDDTNIVIPENRPVSELGNYFHTITAENENGELLEILLTRGDSNLFVDYTSSEGFQLRFRDANFVPDYEKKDSYYLLVEASHRLDNTIREKKWITIRVENDPSDDVTETIEMNATEHSIYENHPTHKDVLYHLDSPPDLQGFSLTENYKDNALFEISDDGRIWWKAHPDYENPQDQGGNNLYHIEAMRTEEDSSITRQHFAITVQDIKQESTYQSGTTAGSVHVGGGTIKGNFSPDSILPEELPRLEIQELMLGERWLKSYPGPITLTWSLTPNRGTQDTLSLDNQAGIDNARPVLERAFAEFEAAANLKFIEVMEGDDSIIGSSVGDITIVVGGAGTGVIVYAGHSIPAFLAIGAPEDYDGLIHEMGHVLGLDHPFSSDGTWPGSNRRLHDPTTIMSYSQDPAANERVLPLDIEALQYLYGAPGDDEGGIEWLSLL